MFVDKFIVAIVISCNVCIVQDGRSPVFDTVRDTLEREAKDIESAKISMSAGNRLLREKKLKLQQLNSYMDADVSRCKHTHVYLMSA